MFREQDLVSMGGPSQLMGAFEYIQNRWEGTYADVYGAGAESLISRGLQMNDFFANEYNDMHKGLMVAEFVPPRFTSMPRDMPDFGDMDELGRRTDDDLFKDDLASAPCLTLEDITPKLPECLREKDDPVPLTAEHCDDAYLQALQDVEDYAERIEAVPLKSTHYR